MATADVRSTNGAPNNADFICGAGTPLVVDRDTGRSYVLRSDGYAADVKSGIRAVSDVGAVADGVTDDTAAFNRATLSTTVYSEEAVRRQVFAPLTYALAGGVYVRKGQTLSGSGVGATKFSLTGNLAPSFSLGQGFIGGLPVTDAGGQPVDISNFNTTGGPVFAAVIYAVANGYFIHDLFISVPATGIEMAGSDGILCDVVIDQGGNGLLISGQNHIISNCNFYNQNYGVTIQSNTESVQFNNCAFTYSTYAAVLLADGATNIKNIKFANCQFLLNVQSSTFLGFIHCRATGADVEFEDCTFVNMNSYAVTYGTGTGTKLKFKNCRFNGTKSNAAYVQSTTAAGVDVGGMSVELQGCEFENLLGQPINFGGSVAATLSLDGVRFSNNTGITTQVNVTNSSASSAVYMRDVAGDARIGVSSIGVINPQTTVPVYMSAMRDWLANGDSGARWYWKIPYFHANQFRVTAIGNIAVAGDGNYRKTSSYLVQKQSGYNGVSKEDSISTATLLQAPVTNFIGLLDVQFDINTVGGGTTTSFNSAGYVVVSMPNTYGSVDVQAEPLI